MRLKKSISLILAFLLILGLFPMNQIAKADDTFIIPTTDEQGNTTFTYQASEDAQEVYLVGSFNGWKQNDPDYQLVKDGDVFTITLSSEELKPGDIEYKYLEDGQWIPDLSPNLTYSVPGEIEEDESGDVTEPEQDENTDEYTYTINYKRQNNDQMNWDMWIFGQGLNGSAYEFETEVDGFAQGTHTFNIDEITVITRPGNWDVQEVNRTITIPEGQNHVEVWIIEDDETVYYENPGDDRPEPIRRSVSFYYDRPQEDYDGWGVWTWSTGLSDRQNEFDKEGFTKAIISNSATNVGFKINKDSWSQIDQDYDRSVETDPNALERTTKIYLVQGQGEFFQVPYVYGPEIKEGTISFYYRDLELYETDDFDSIDKVEINIIKESLETGEQTSLGTFEMLKDGLNQYYVYNLEDADQGYRYFYTFNVTTNGNVEENQIDQFNDIDGSSYIDYRSSNISITASARANSVEAGDSIVIDVEVDNPDDEEIKEIYIDGLNLGNEAKIPVELGLLSQSVEVGYYVQAGEKEVEVVLVDQYDNRSTATITVTTLANSDTGANVAWDEEIIYFMLTDRFADGDKSNNPAGYDPNHLEAYHGGDFQGIIDNVDYLRNLGITTVWITPIVDNIDFNLRESVGSKQYGYHGYWAENFEKIEASLGSEDKLKEMIDVLNDNGIKLMVDVVLNHSGYETKNKGIFEGMHRQTSGGNDLTMELAGLPDFLTENPEVSKLLVEWQSQWLNRLRTDKGNSIDYFRIDTVKHVEAETWKEFKNALVDIDPSFKMIGEQYGASIDNTGGYLGRGMMDSLLDFEFKNLADNFLKGNIKEVEDRLAYRNSKLNPNLTMGQFLSSHDEDGFLIARLNGNEDLMKVAASLQLTAKGQPVIYYGEEIGMSGLNANFDQGRYGENRKSFDWSKVENNPMLDHYKKMIKIRRDYSEVFSRGDRQSLFADENVSVFSRNYNGQSVIVALNISDVERQITIDLENFENKEFLDLYFSQAGYLVEGNSLKLTVPANSDGGTLVLALSDEVKPVDPTEPTDPVEPVDPAEPVDPTKPTDPVKPADPTEPTDPVEPVGPSKPEEPVKPIEVRPIESGDHSKPGSQSPKTSDIGLQEYIILGLLASSVLLVAKKKSKETI